MGYEKEKLKKANEGIEKKEHKSKYSVKILKDVDYDKLAEECKICKRLKFNKGQCGGREGLNICLGFEKSPIAEYRVKAYR